MVVVGGEAGVHLLAETSARRCCIPLPGAAARECPAKSLAHVGERGRQGKEMGVSSKQSQRAEQGWRQAKKNLLPPPYVCEGATHPKP